MCNVYCVLCPAGGWCQEDSSEVSSSCMPAMPPMSEPIDEAKAQAPVASISNGVKEEQAWVTVEGEFILGDISQVGEIS